ncbi:MAG: hypothetical protein H0W88_12775 [Parachlamydiaceae bacterium]|nr:hypothetical protein [Parachlamydiaceae bacterium]
MIEQPFSLVGNDAFYKHPQYIESTKQELASNALTSHVDYVYQSENYFYRIGKKIFSIVVFPIIVYRVFHEYMGKKIIPATSSRLYKYSNELRKQINLRQKWKYKRLAIEVDGKRIDAILVGTEKTLGNRRWVLVSNGNGELYEYRAQGKELHTMLTLLGGNALLFNYPGVGASQGAPNRQLMKDVYRGMLAFLEDSEKGIGATEIIAYGHSIGAGIQGEAVDGYALKENIKYVFVKSRTFSSLSDAVYYISKSTFLEYLIKILGWDINPLRSSLKLKSPEIILQTVKIQEEDDSDHLVIYTDLTEKEIKFIVDDEIIPYKASLARALLEKRKYSNKVFIGIPESHNEPLSDIPYLVRKIEEKLSG